MKRVGETESFPNHGMGLTCRVVQRNDPDVTVVKQLFPEEGSIQVHQLRVCVCPQFPIGYYWYGGNRHCVGRTPTWVEGILSSGAGQSQNDEGQDDSNDAEQSQNSKGKLISCSDPVHMAEPVGSIEDKQNDYVVFTGELENMLNDATLNVEYAEGPKDVSTE